MSAAASRRLGPTSRLTTNPDNLAIRLLSWPSFLLGLRSHVRMMSMDITKTQQDAIQDVARHYQLQLVLLFGSQSEGRIHKESDVDVAYLPERPLSFEEEYRLNYEFTNIFRTDKVDTADLKKAPPLLLYAIFQHPVVLFQKNELVFPNYQVYAFKKYVETKPLYEEKYRRLQEKISQT